MKEQSLKKNKCIFIIAMAVLLIAQLLTLFYFGGQKQGFHEDELYTYYSSNKTAGLPVGDRQWMTREEIRNDFVVLPGEQFRYGIVKQVQSWDVHPPLYYYIFHTVCSLFPGVFSKWLGIGINLIAYVFSFALLGYCVYTAVTGGQEKDAENEDGNLEKKARALVLLTCLVWGFSGAVISGVMFIRMYQWLTVFLLLCSALHLRAIKKQDFGIGHFLLPLGLTVFLGFLTQYYYIIFHFFLGAGFCFYLLRRKKIKVLVSYAITCALGLFAAICYYPASLSHIFRGYRGTEAVSEFGNAGNTWERLQFFYQLLDEYVMNGTLSFWLLLLCLLAVTAGYIRKKDGKNSATGFVMGPSIGLLLFTCAGYFFVISKTALLLGETSNRYQLPIYGLLLFLLLYAVWTLVHGFLERLLGLREKGVQKGSLALFVLLVLVLLVMDGTALKNGKVFFLYEEEGSVMEYVKENASCPVVVFYHEASPDKVWWLSDELMEYPEIFLASQGNEEAITDEKILSGNRLLIYVADYENKEACLERLLEANENLSTYGIVAQKGSWTLYEME